jgi:hypothetical protein
MGGDREAEGDRVVDEIPAEDDSIIVQMR